MLNDLKFSLRSLRRQPGFALAAIATLAVGIGATTAIFSTVNAALLRPLPFSEAKNLYAVYTPATDGRFTTGRDSGVELARLNDPSVSIERAAGSGRFDSTILRDDGTPVSTVAYGVTEGFFELFRVPMMLGRPFAHAEYAPGAAPVAVLSTHLWRDMFGSDPAIIGKAMRVANGPPQPFTIVGVARAELDVPRGADFWVTIPITPQSTGHGFDGYVRIKPGTRLERLESEMAGAMAGIARDYGMLGKNRRYELRPLVTAMVGDLRATLVVVLAAAALLLLLACVNVTNLLLARGSVRAREIAVRVALGAGRGRIVRQLLTESLVLATAGTVVGLVFAYISVQALLAFGASQLPRLDRVPFIDVRVLSFALGALVVTALIVGFAPALRLAGTSLKSLMNESGRTSSGGGAAHRTLKTMIVAEIALAITLVAGAGWLVRSFSNLGTTDAGFISQGRLVFDILLPGSRLLPPPGSGRVTGAMIADRQATWTRTLEDSLRPIAGVADVATAATTPFGMDRDGVLYVGVQGDAVDPDHPQVARAHRINEHFFNVMGVKLAAGRDFTADDRSSTMPVAIVNRTFAKRYFGGRNPLTMKFTAGYPEVPQEPVYTVVGVVDDVKYVSLAQAADPAYYTPAAQTPYFTQSVVVKTALANPISLAGSIRAAVRKMDPELPITPQSLNDIVATSLRRQRLGMTLMLIFAGAALALAAVGIYGVIAYASAQRVPEVATRMALGATPTDVFWLLMGQGRVLAIVGTVVGLGAAYVAGRAGSSLLYEVRASDPVILIAATTIVLGITSLAIVFPARRVSRIEPSRILRLD
jgi:putative ABC transport system permease protein